jgi:hypothetical protein
MAVQIKFGTDGWRGEIARDYTFESVQRAAQGFATYIKNQRRAGDGIVVGYDKRFHSENFAAAVAEVLAGNGIRAERLPCVRWSFNNEARRSRCSDWAMAGTGCSRAWEPPCFSPLTCCIVLTGMTRSSS